LELECRHLQNQASGQTSVILHKQHKIYILVLKKLRPVAKKTQGLSHILQGFHLSIPQRPTHPAPDGTELAGLNAKDS